jgi:hypothetical protein
MQAPSTPPAIPPSLRRRHLAPHIYIPSSSHWVPLPENSPNADLLPRDTLVRIISWNIDFSTPAHYDRTTTALDYLASLFSPLTSTTSAPMILMLQEMSDESLDAILAHPWARRNFVVSDKTPLPQMYFTLLLVDRRLVTGGWFRIEYPETEYRRDVLGVDILVAFGDDETAQNGRPARRLRFLTTHLESLAEEAGHELRPKQLSLVSSLLKEKSVARHGYEIVGGVVGGDMNAISEVDEGIHKRDDVGLRDVGRRMVKIMGRLILMVRTVDRARRMIHLEERRDIRGDFSRVESGRQDDLISSSIREHWTWLSLKRQGMLVGRLGGLGWA